MTVREAITFEMESLVKNPKIVFLGENIINSKRIYGTLDKVPISKCIEMPVAENLIAGTAIGLAFKGYIPICIFQRMDFMLIAADAIINHACLLPKMTGIACPVIFRTIKGERGGKFYVGEQHCKDLTHVFKPYMPITSIPNKRFSIETAYKSVLDDVLNGKSSLIVEDYSKFNDVIK